MELEGLEGLEVVGRDRRGGAGLLHAVGVAREVEVVAHRIIGCAIEVHRHLGPGLLEKLYEDALVYELKAAGLRVAQQREIVVPYKSIELRGQRLDLVVNECVIVENKAVAQILDVHKAQLLSYVRAANMPLGLLLNFNVAVLKEGLRRVVNDRFHPTLSTPAPPSSSSSPSS